MTRTKIPKAIEDKVLAANRHLCCICHIESRAVQIHHIDGDPTNNDIKNLAVLCTQHHEEVERKSPQGKGYRPSEVAIYKEQWEDHCKLEKNKGVIVKNYFVLSDKFSLLKDPEMMENFMFDVSNSANMAGLTMSTTATANRVEIKSEGKLTSADILSKILKGT
jgi:hypothetical protein